MLKEEASIEISTSNVFVRVNPPSKLEVAKRSKTCLNVVNDGKSVTFFSPTNQEEHRYDFNRVFDENTHENTIFKSVVEPMAPMVLKGQNCAIVSSGAEGSGKTRSLIGNQTFKSTDLNTQDGLESFEEGIIPSTTRELFELMANSSSENEFIIKVSFFEVHRDEVCDLLQIDNRFLRIHDHDDGDHIDALFPQIHGLSEYCCVRALDVLALLNKGHSNRLIRNERYNTSIKLSSTVFSIKIEQRNMITDCVKKGCFAFINLPLDGPTGSTNVMEISFVNILRSLDDYWKMNTEPPSEVEMKSFRFASSKLTRVLQNVLIGNCKTSYLLHLSNSSSSAEKTLNSLHIGAVFRNMKTCPKENVKLSLKMFEEEVEKYRNAQLEIIKLLNEIKTEFDHIRGESDDELLNGSVWKELDAVCRNYTPNLDHSRENGFDSPNASRDESIDMLRQKLKMLTKERDHAIESTEKLKEECKFLSTQCQEVLKSKKNSMELMMSTENEIHRLNQKKLEMEHNLRTSRFRENESVTFLRHIYKFYRRLLQNLLTQGSGDLNNIVASLASAPNLSDLTDISEMLAESGLIETFEIDQGISKSEDYKPSKEALLRSSEYAQKIKNEESNEPTLLKLQNTKAAIHRSLSMDKNISSTTGSPHLPTTKSPAYKFTEARLEELEIENLKLSKQNTEQRMQIVDLEKKLGNLSSDPKKKPTKKQRQVDQIAIAGYKADLEKKQVDLEAVIWKMNELHLINKSYKDKLWNRDQHIAYLDESLRREIDKNYNNAAMHTEEEKRLQREVNRLNTLIESLTSNLWKETESDSLLVSRILIPIQGGIVNFSADPLLRDKSFAANEGTKSDIQGALHDTSMKKNPSHFGESQSTLGARPTREVLIHSDDVKGDEITLPDFPILPTNVGSENLKEKTIPVFLLAGGKPYDHQPNVFSSKRGRIIKSATLRENRDEIQGKRDRMANLNETRQRLDRLEVSVRKDLFRQ